MALAMKDATIAASVVASLSLSLGFHAAAESSAGNCVLAIGCFFYTFCLPFFIPHNQILYALRVAIAKYRRYIPKCMSFVSQFNSLPCRLIPDLVFCY